MLTHAANNAVSGNFCSQMFNGVDAVHQSLMLTLVWGVAALVIIVSGRLQHSETAVNTVEQPLMELV